MACSIPSISHISFFLASENVDTPLVKEFVSEYKGDDGEEEEEEEEIEVDLEDETDTTLHFNAKTLIKRYICPTVLILVHCFLLHWI